MPGIGKPFEKGKAPGKPKGATNKIDKAAKELFLEIMEGEVDHIKDSLESLRKKDKGKYLEVLAKFFPYFIPKKLEHNIPGQTVIKVVREE
jgi:hypothetical protein